MHATSTASRPIAHMLMAVVLFVGVAGCGGEDTRGTTAEDTPMGGADTTAMADTSMMMDDMSAMQGDTVEVTLVDFDINMPTTLPAGRTVFRVTNEGTAEHNFEVEGQGMEHMLPSNLQPGQTQTLQVDIQEGSYVVYCPVANHRSRGMETNLMVEPGTGVVREGN